MEMSETRHNKQYIVNYVKNKCRVNIHNIYNVKFLEDACVRSNYGRRHVSDVTLTGVLLFR